MLKRSVICVLAAVLLVDCVTAATVASEAPVTTNCIRDRLHRRLLPRFNGTPVREAIVEILSVTGVRWRVEQNAKVVFDSAAPITLELQQPISARSWLRLILQTYNLDYLVEPAGIVVVTTETAERQISRRVFDLREIIDSGSDATQVAERLRKKFLIRDSHCKLLSGGKQLQVIATWITQSAVADELQRLRVEQREK